MTQPNTVNMTFDTSLVDVQRSFSSTETNTSASTGKENMPPDEETDQTPRLRGSPFKEIPTEELYEQWASTYDTDGNILQFVDDLQMVDLMDQFVKLSVSKVGKSRATADDEVRILDLGCGTGRNTLKLLQAPWNRRTSVSVHGWDGSQAMLDMARSKCGPSKYRSVHFEVVDITNPIHVPASIDSSFDGLVSTLVLEHIPIAAYFTLIARVLKPGAHAVITNMHSDMGRLSRAGFKTASGERFKAISFIYTPAETAEAAATAGLEVVGEIGERAVEEAMIDGGLLENGFKVKKGMVAERARKWVGTKVWYGMVLRKR